jgi:trehalose 6-phosphate synthase/phosphatase
MDRRRRSPEGPMSLTSKRLVVVSNRLPFSFRQEKGEMHASPSSGGLVSALVPILAEQGGIWIGSTGEGSGSERHDEAIRELLAKRGRGLSYTFQPVFLTREEHANFYEGFSNEILWPLFHDLQSRCKFAPSYWKYYQRVNRRFANTILQTTSLEDLVWIHDYQLMTVARELRHERPDARLAFFMHIPFPGPDIFEKLPWRQALLEALLEHDVIGLQTHRDERNFIACLRAFLPEARIGGQPGAGRIVTLRARRTYVQFFPISIDFRRFAADAATESITTRALEIRNQLNPARMTLGVDRLDYTKGIPERLRAFAALLREYPEFRGKVCLYQVVVPSRETITGYRKLQAEIERLVTHINGEHTHPGWAPIHYVHRALPREELLALYRAADAALVTPLKDGMNLVSKEYCAARTDNDGVLILSEFAGAAPELRTGAMLVNPYDELGIAAALARALRMDPSERRKRMLRLRAQIRRHDILRWRDSFFEALERTA